MHTKILGKQPKWIKITKNIVFHNFEHSSLPILMIKQKQLDTQLHVAPLSFLCNSNVRYSFTCLKTWGKGPKRLKTLKN